jgi:DNA adenine methylase
MGVKFMLSNSDTKFVNELYSNYDIKKVFASRQINANADGRGKITEVLVRNY